MKLFLAPMEGVVDWVMRDLLTQMGGIDQCVTEFVRVTDQLLPAHVFLRDCPELATKSQTRAGVPVFVQLLGGQAAPLADNALRAVELGACGIDLNFGCPAKIVNRHDGGAAILKSPCRVLEIVSAVRKAVPAEIPVTAKIRLGFDNPSDCLENAKAAADGGASWLTVHCRTKTDMYKPPAYWEWIPKIREVTSIPIVANGEVWTVEDYFRCREISGCDQIMIGRGAIADPFLFKKIRRATDNLTATPEAADWQQLKSFLPAFFKTNSEWKSEFFAQARTKQWLRQLCLHYPEAIPTFDQLKVITRPDQFQEQMSQLLQ